jgi:hypothetical protein
VEHLSGALREQPALINQPLPVVVGMGAPLAPSAALPAALVACLRHRQCNAYASVETVCRCSGECKHKPQSARMQWRALCDSLVLAFESRLLEVRDCTSSDTPDLPY